MCLLKVMDEPVVYMFIVEEIGVADKGYGSPVEVPVSGGGVGLVWSRDYFYCPG